MRISPLKFILLAFLGVIIHLPVNAKSDGMAVKSAGSKLNAGALPRDKATLVLKEWMRDPYVTLGPDNHYYLTCTRLWNTPLKPGMEVWRSDDLVNWEPEGLIWSFDDSRWMAGPLARMKEEMKKDAHLWAPEISYIDGQWVSVFTSSLRYSNLVVSRGGDLKGPYAEPFGEPFHYKHDPSLFVDDDGSRWLVWACTKIARLKDDYSGFAGPEINIAPSDRKMGHEGCFILKIGGKYVLFGTAWSQDVLRHGSYNLYYCTADKIEGPYGPRKFAGRFLGHGTIFRDKKGEWWCTAFLNGTYVTPEHVARYGISKTKAETINPQGLTLVPMEIGIVNGDVVVRALDPDYASPGDDEMQDFSDAGQTATGFVYEDANANLKRDRMEKGIPNVAVSNGREVTLTDQTGKYSLPVGSDDIIFVVKPSGYKTRFDENNLPRFYHIHKPAGSPVLQYKGSPATGALSASVDFPLYTTNETESFEVLLFGDPQAYNKNELRYFDRRIVSELAGKAQNYSFGISVGDLVGNDPDLFLPYAEVIRKIGIPWYNVIGNHDLNHDATNDLHADESFEAVFGPSTYSFNYGKAHFIIIKDILWPDPRDKNGYWGGFTEQQFAFLENDLKLVPKDHLVVMAFHIPLWEGYVENDIFRDEDRQRLFSLLKEFPHNLTISAHSHIQFNKLLSAKDGWPAEKPHHHLNLGTTCGSWYSGALGSDGIPWSVMADGTPQGYALMKVDGNQYAITYKVAGSPVTEQMKLHHPLIIGKAPKSQAPIFVNFFMGTEKDELLFRVDGGKWIPMNYVIETDPSYLNLLHQWDYSEEVIPGRRPNEPRESLHLWRAVLPSNLAVGEHLIEVRATDLYGQVHWAKSKYKIGQSKGNE